jgi:oxygen-independent coproporphyrinogen-3 oxidase
VVYAGAAARGPASRIPAFLTALHAELDLRADDSDLRWPDRPPLRTLYLGGGTPSLLSGAQVEALIEHVRARFGLADRAEITLEANPGPHDRGDLEAFAAAGVTRVSFGAQSLDDGELRRLGRRHVPGDVADAVALARAAGVASVNLDLLYDIPGATMGGWGRTLEAAIALQPDHLSLYALTLDDPEAEGLTGPSGDHLPTARGARAWRRRARAAQDDDLAVAEYRFAVERLADAGFGDYEISNWARPGHESRHNLAYWRREPYEALGPGAHAFDGRLRRWNAARLDGYVGALCPGGLAAPALPPGGCEVVDEATAAAEFVILGLRLATGLPRETLEGGRFAAPLRWGLDHGLLAEAADGDRVALTTTGRLLSNELFARLL